MSDIAQVVQHAHFFAIPKSWNKHIRHENVRLGGKADYNALAVMSDIVYALRYTKSQILSNQVCETGYSEYVIRSAQDIADSLNLSKQQVTDILHKLRHQGYVKQKFISLKTQSGIVPKASLLSLNLTLLASITDKEKPVKNNIENETNVKLKNGRTQEVKEVDNKSTICETGSKAADTPNAFEEIKPKTVCDKSFSKDKEVPKKDDHENDGGGAPLNEIGSQLDSRGTGWIYDVCKKSGVLAYKQSVHKLRGTLVKNMGRQKIEKAILWYGGNHGTLRNHTSTPNLYGFIHWFGEIERAMSASLSLTDYSKGFYVVKGAGGREVRIPNGPVNYDVDWDGNPEESFAPCPV